MRAEIKREPIQLNENYKRLLPYRNTSGRITLTIAEIDNILKENGFIMALNRKEKIAREIEIIQKEDCEMMTWDLSADYSCSPTSQQVFH